VITGCVIGESLRSGAVLELPDLRIRRITRLDQSGTASADQPQVWTVIDFETSDHHTQQLAQELAACLASDGGWYADFRTGDERVVVFAGKVFSFQRGDTAARAEAAAHGRSVGVPEHQLDWRD